MRYRQQADPTSAGKCQYIKLFQGRTTIIIAHRLSTVQDADRIAVIEDRRIVELGGHEELIARDGEYAALIRSQELRYG